MGVEALEVRERWETARDGVRCLGYQISKRREKRRVTFASQNIGQQLPF